MQKPNAASVAIMADKLPKNPSHGFERTTSPIIHVIILKKQKIWNNLIMKLIKHMIFNTKMLTTKSSSIVRTRKNYYSKQNKKMNIHLKEPIKRNVEVKYGTTVRVFFSSSWSNVRDANRAIRMCLNIPLSSACPTTRKNSSSHSPPLQ